MDLPHSVVFYSMMLAFWCTMLVHREQLDTGFILTLFYFIGHYLLHDMQTLSYLLHVFCPVTAASEWWSSRNVLLSLCSP